MADSDTPVGRRPLPLTLPAADPNKPEATFIRIARALTHDIRRGRLRPGARLPGSRSLAESLSVHRNTVLAAYRELLAEGWLESINGKGTFVATAIPETRALRFDKQRSRSSRTNAPPKHGDAPSPRRDDGLSLRGDNPPLAPEPSLGPATLAMYGGLPDLRLLPVAAISRAHRRQLHKPLQNLNYGTSWGVPTLRSAVAEMLNRTRGLAITPDDVVITRGSQMAIALSARAMLSPGDLVAVEQWGYPPAWEALKQAGAKLVPIPVDEQGLDVEQLAQVCEQKRISLLYTTPHHQFPTAVTLPPARRLQLLDLAERHRFAILEDDYDHEYHYDGRPLLPLASAEHAGRVIYVGTFSKILAPGLRLGYLVAERPLLERVVASRQLLDRQGDNTWEAAVADLMDDGELSRHVSRTRRVYQGRRDHCVKLLTESFADRLDIRVPPGGMALWLRAKRGLDVEGWQQRAAARGVLFQTAKAYHFDRRVRPFIRLGYAALDEHELTRALAQLQAALP